MIAPSERPARLARPGHPPAGVVLTLHPGDVACADEGDRFETLLGSCVAVILTDPRRTVAVMCHVVHCGGAVSAAPRTAAHAEVAFAAMFSLLQARCIDPLLCEAYVYGGGNMFPDLMATMDVGDCNARWALDALARAGIRVLLCDVGCNTYRRLSWIVGPDAPRVTAVQV